MNSSEIIQYTREVFYQIKNTINTSISEEVKMVISQIDKCIRNDNNSNTSWKKVNNSNTSNMVPNWRITRTPIIKKSNNKEDIIKNDINSYLNKISKKNFKIMVDKLVKTCQDNVDIIDFTIDNIFQKAVYQPTYCEQYVLLLTIFLQHKLEINHIIEAKCDKYTNMLDVEDEPEKDPENNTYDDFCLSIKNKTYKVGYSQFIGELFNKDLIKSIVIYNNMEKQVNCLKKILDTNPESSNVENNIICLCKLIQTTHKKMDNIENIMTDISNIHKNNGLSKRLKFKIMDIIDLYNST